MKNQSQYSPSIHEQGTKLVPWKRNESTVTSFCMTSSMYSFCGHIHVCKTGFTSLFVWPLLYLIVGLLIVEGCSVDLYFSNIYVIWSRGGGGGGELSHLHSYIIDYKISLFYALISDFSKKTTTLDLITPAHNSNTTQTWKNAEQLKCEKSTSWFMYKTTKIYDNKVLWNSSLFTFNVNKICFFQWK